MFQNTIDKIELKIDKIVFDDDVQNIKLFLYLIRLMVNEIL